MTLAMYLIQDEVVEIEERVRIEPKGEKREEVTMQSRKLRIRQRTEVEFVFLF
jgi:hypothetical protein